LTPEDLSGFSGIQTLRNDIWKIVRKIIGKEIPLQNIQISKMTVK
jgi:flagellar FliL protein